MTDRLLIALATIAALAGVTICALADKEIPDPLEGSTLVLAGALAGAAIPTKPKEV